jgi:hypothetical protein
MIAEPYICTKGPTAGEIWWWNSDGQCVYEGCIDKKVEECWVPYAAFEREKLRGLESVDGIDVGAAGYRIYLLGVDRGPVFSEDVTAYTQERFDADSESDRLLKRAEFLKAVCEKEGVEWLPQDRVVAHVQAHDIPPEGIDIVHELTKPLPDSHNAV